MPLVDYKTLPGGVFRTLLDLWDTVRITYVEVLEWMTSNSVGGVVSSTVLSAMLGVGIFAVLGYSIIKWLIP